MEYLQTKYKHTWSRHDQPQANHAMECWSVMQQCNISHSTVGIIASGYTKPGRRVSILKCAASHCSRSTQTLLISHLLQFQSANIKIH